METKLLGICIVIASLVLSGTFLYIHLSSIYCKIETDKGGADKILD
jgi:hypothetical protein